MNIQLKFQGINNRLFQNRMESINKTHRLKKLHLLSCILVTISGYLLCPSSPLKYPATKSESIAKLVLVCSLNISVGKLSQITESNILCAPWGKLRPQKVPFSYSSNLDLQHVLSMTTLWPRRQHDQCGPSDYMGMINVS